VRLFKKLRRKLAYLDDQQVDMIHQAYLMAFEAHRNQKRQTGEPYISHPVAGKPQFPQRQILFAAKACIRAFM